MRAIPPDDRFDSRSRLFGIDLWLVGAAHFVILSPAFQVPVPRTEGGKARDVAAALYAVQTVKLLWYRVDSSVLTDIAFGTLTLLLHTELPPEAERAAVGLSLALSEFTGC